MRLAEALAIQTAHVIAVGRHRLDLVGWDGSAVDKLIHDSVRQGVLVRAFGPQQHWHCHRSLPNVELVIVRDDQEALARVVNGSHQTAGAAL
jgi:hypothetical protein